MMTDITSIDSYLAELADGTKQHLLGKGRGSTGIFLVFIDIAPDEPRYKRVSYAHVRLIVDGVLHEEHNGRAMRLDVVPLAVSVYLDLIGIMQPEISWSATAKSLENLTDRWPIRTLR